MVIEVGLESINASDLFRDEVSCSEGKKIGEVVNIIFHPELHDVRLVIFPKKFTRFNLRRLVDLGLKITENEIKKHSFPFDEKLNELIDNTALEGVDFVAQEAYEYLKEIEDKLRETYFLIPAFAIKESHPKKLHLKETKGKYYDCHNAAVLEEDLSFYNETAYTDSENKFKITLDKGTIRGQIVVASDGQKGRVSDIVFDASTSTITELKVHAVGRGAGKKSIKIEDFDFKEMTSKNPFG